MKMVWVGIGLLVATVVVGVACGPKEKYCYDEKLPCSQVRASQIADALWEAPEVEAAPQNCGFAPDGATITDCEK